MAQLGNTRRFYIMTGDNYTWLAGEQTNSFNRTAEAIETSDKSTDWAQFIGGKKGATAEVTVYTDDSNAQQTAALKALHVGAVVGCFCGVIDDSEPTEGDAFSAVVTSISDTNDNGAVSTRSISLTASGAVTHYPTL